MRLIFQNGKRLYLYRDYFHVKKKTVRDPTSRISYRLATRYIDTARALVCRKGRFPLEKGRLIFWLKEMDSWLRIVDSSPLYKLHRELDGSFNFKSDISLFVFSMDYNSSLTVVKMHHKGDSSRFSVRRDGTGRKNTGD